MEEASASTELGGNVSVNGIRSLKSRPRLVCRRCPKPLKSLRAATTRMGARLTSPEKYRN